MGLFEQRLPTFGVVRGKAQGVKVFDRVFGVKNAHHHFFAKGGGQRGQAHFNLVALGVAGFDAAVLRAAPLNDIHAGQNLDARGHGQHDRWRQLVDRVQHAVNAKADHALFTPGLEVDVAGAHVKGVLPQPVHHHHHALVVGVELLVGFAQFYQLLKAHARLVAVFQGGTHRVRQGIKLGGVARNVLRVGQHQPHPAARLAFHLGQPVGGEGLAGGHHNLCGAHGHWQHFVALGVGGGKGLGHLAYIDLERVNAQIG